MVYNIEPVKSADIPSITIIQWAALQSNPLIQTLYPRGPTPSLTDFTVISYQKSTQYPSVRLIKAVDPETGSVVAFAKWIVFRKDRHESEQAVNQEQDKEAIQAAGGWHRDSRGSLEPPDCYTRALQEWKDTMNRTRKGIMGTLKHTCDNDPTHSLSCYFACYGDNLMVLDILHTHPAHEGKGAGAQLVKWGTDLADEEGLQCYAEASPVAVSLLRFSGFDDITEMAINLGALRAGQPEYKHLIMVRPPYGSQDLNRLSQAPEIPPKSEERPTINLMDADPEWVEKVSDFEDSVRDSSSETSSDDEEHLRPLSIPYMAEARMLNLRSSSSTGSPRLESVSAAMRSSSSI